MLLPFLCDLAPLREMPFRLFFLFSYRLVRARSITVELTGITSYIVISLILFLAGLLTVISKKNIIGIFMGIELILNSAALNFAAFSRLTARNLEGQMVSLFVIVLAAAEAAIALALLLAIYKRYRDINADNLTTLKW